MGWLWFLVLFYVWVKMGPCCYFLLPFFGQLFWVPMLVVECCQSSSGYVPDILHSQATVASSQKCWSTKFNGNHRIRVLCAVTYKRIILLFIIQHNMETSNIFQLDLLIGICGAYIFIYACTEYMVGIFN